MRAAIYSPYLDTFGGGEKYMMTIAEVLSKNRMEVDVLLDINLMNFKSEIKVMLSNRFNLDLEGVNFIPAPIGAGSDFSTRLFFLKKYDILFYLTDGSIFFPTAKKNILHIQSPISGEPAKNIWGKIKLKGWNSIIYNSNFTKDYSSKNWPILSEVIYPPADVNKIRPWVKEKKILSVGRFFGYLKTKKHEEMINVFRNLVDKEKTMKGWSLHVVGSAGEGDTEYVNFLKVLSKGLPVEFYPNLEYKKLIKLYSKASIYWHAAGFGETDPTKMEHFGISVVEAMAGGVVPVVVNKGGLGEIVLHKESGFLWDSLEQLKEFTIELIEKNNLRNKMSKFAVERAKIFSKNVFSKKILEVLGK